MDKPANSGIVFAIGLIMTVGGLGSMLTFIITAVSQQQWMGLAAGACTIVFISGLILLKFVDEAT